MQGELCICCKLSVQIRTARRVVYMLSASSPGKNLMRVVDMLLAISPGKYCKESGVYVVSYQYR